MTVQSEHGDETVEGFRILRNTANISVSYNLTNLMVVPFNLLIVIRLLSSLPFFYCIFGHCIYIFSFIYIYIYI